MLLRLFFPSDPIEDHSLVVLVVGGTDCSVRPLPKSGCKVDDIRFHLNALGMRELLGPGADIFFAVPAGYLEVALRDYPNASLGLGFGCPAFDWHSVNLFEYESLLDIVTEIKKRRDEGTLRQNYSHAVFYQTDHMDLEGKGRFMIGSPTKPELFGRAFGEVFSLFGNPNLSYIHDACLAEGAITTVLEQFNCRTVAFWENATTGRTYSTLSVPGGDLGFSAEGNASLTFARSTLMYRTLAHALVRPRAGHASVSEMVKMMRMMGTSMNEARVKAGEARHLNATQMAALREIPLVAMTVKAGSEPLLKMPLRKFFGGGPAGGKMKCIEQPLEDEAVLADSGLFADSILLDSVRNEVTTASDVRDVNDYDPCALAFPALDELRARLNVAPSMLEVRVASLRQEPFPKSFSPLWRKMREVWELGYTCFGAQYPVVGMARLLEDAGRNVSEALDLVLPFVRVQRLV